MEQARELGAFVGGGVCGLQQRVMLLVARPLACFLAHVNCGWQECFKQCGLRAHPVHANGLKQLNEMLECHTSPVTTVEDPAQNAACFDALKFQLHRI